MLDLAGDGLGFRPRRGGPPVTNRAFVAARLPGTLGQGAFAERCPRSGDPDLAHPPRLVEGELFGVGEGREEPVFGSRAVDRPGGIDAGDHALRSGRGQLGQQSGPGRVKVLEFVDHQVREPGDHLSGDHRIGQQLFGDRGQHVPVEQVGGGEDPVVNLDQFGQLAAVLAFPFGPVDPDQHLAQQPSRVAADLVVSERQIIDPGQQHRQPLGRTDDFEGGAEPGFDRPVAEDLLGQSFPGEDGERLVGAGQVLLEPGPVGGGGPVGRGDERDP